MKPVRDFLQETGFIQTWEQMQPVEEAFIDHMQKGLKGEASSLPMLPAYLTVDALHDENRRKSPRCCTSTSSPCPARISL